MYTKNDKSYRKTYLVKEIERNKKEITKNTAFLGASALAVGIGALGVTLLGDDVVNAFTSGNALTLGSYIAIRYQGYGFLLSAEAVLGGIYAAIKNSKNVVSSVKNLKQNKINLEELEEKGRSR